MKKIFVVIMAVILCVSLVACQKTQKNVMEYEREAFMPSHYEPYTPERLREKILENSNGYVIKITVTEEYENVLIYDEAEDRLGDLKGVAGYEKLPKTNGGYPISEFIDTYFSYMLTTVKVEEIYYLGENIKFSNGQSIKLVEHCCIVSKDSLWKLLQNDDDEKVLKVWPERFKLEPGKEYIIFGKLGTNEGRLKDKYLFLSHTANRFEPDKTRPADYYDSKNAQQVIEDIFTEYEQRIRENYSYVLEE